MIAKLPEWYKFIKLKYSEEELERRSKIILDIQKTKDKDFFLNLVATYLGKLKSKDIFYVTLKDKFLKNDPMFPQSGNELELRVLAGAILHEFITQSKSKESNIISLALITASFGIPENKIVNPDILEDVEVFFNNEANYLRLMNEFEPFASVFEFPESISVIDEVKEAFINYNSNSVIEELNETLRNFDNKLNIVAEESNILWWTMSKYSRDSKKPLKDLDIEDLILVLGKELADFTRFTLPMTSGKGILNFLLLEKKKNNLKLKLADIINNSKRTWKEKFLSIDTEKIKYICPLLFAISKSLESKNNDSWKASFTSVTSISSVYQAIPIDFSYQFYLECLFIKFIR